MTAKLDQCDDATASRMEPESVASDFQMVLVWDAPVRVFHGLMAVCFTGAYLTAEQPGWRTAHATLGYTMVGLVIFRIFWGFTGTRYARFANFVRGPKAIASYLREFPYGWGRRYLGHSPAGALSVIALLLLALLITASGWAAYGTSAANRLNDLHRGAAYAMLAVVALHIAGVMLGSWRSGENLAHSVFNGTKLGSSNEAIRSAWKSVALLLVAAVLGFWGYQWRSDGIASPERSAPATEVRRASDGAG